MGEESGKKQDRFTYLTTTPVPKLISMLAVPTVISMLVTGIYNTADTFFVGRISTQATAAVGLVFSVMAIIQALGFFCGHGSGNYLARMLGAGNQKEANEAASTGFALLIIGAGLAASWASCFQDTMASWLGATHTTIARYLGLYADHPDRRAVHDVPAGHQQPAPVPGKRRPAFKYRGWSYGGDAAIAGMSVVTRVMMLLSSALIGFGQGYQPVCSFNYGAGLRARVKEGYLFCVKIRDGILTLGAVPLHGLCPADHQMFRDDPDVIPVGTVALRCSPSLPLWLSSS